jgi:hypothetical protein
VLIKNIDTVCLVIYLEFLYEIVDLPIMINFDCEVCLVTNPEFLYDIGLCLKFTFNFLDEVSNLVW